MAWKINRTRGPWQSEGLSDERYRRGPQRGEPRELMIEIEPRAIVFRPKGTRRRLRVTLERAFQLACEIEAAARRVSRPRIRRSAIRIGG